jgi:hypothetical protein
MIGKKKIFQIFILILLLAWYGLFFVHKIDLTTADLGRHLKNGQLILQGNFGILKTNFYSYTHPDYSVVNHHWGGGVIFYLIWKLFGFTGLSLFYLIISLIIFCLFFRIAQKEAGFKIAALVSILSIPLIAARTEIRPEIFSYLFAGFFFWILWHYRKGFLSDKWLFVLPILGICWVNTHIYFVFGPALVGLFLFEGFLEKITGLRSLSRAKRGVSFAPRNDKIKKPSPSRHDNKNFGLVFLLTIVATLFNPFGLKGVFYPFNIFRNYGYKIIENQSVWFLERLGIISNPNLALFKIVFLVLVLSFILVFIRKRRSFSIIYFCLAVVLSVMAWLAIRNFTLFGFFALPIIAYNIKKGLGQKIKFNSLNIRLGLVFLGLAIFLITFFTHYQRLPLEGNKFGFGLVPENNQSAEFFKREKIQGPILNNYDIGSYLIYHLYPEELVFVDNRPEAYPAAFFQEIYIPLQEDKAVWQEQDKLYNFNVIFFSHRDATPWGQKFLIERLNDPLWAPVFADQYAIIFLKRNTLNQAIIEKYEIPKNYFRVIK